MAEAWKAYELKDYNRAEIMAVKAKANSDKSMELIKAIMYKAEEEKRIIAEKEIAIAKKQGKDTFEAENYMQQRNYDEALRVIGYAKKKKTKQIGIDKRRVLKNDSLWNIAIEVYGDGFKWRVIYNANKQLKNPNKIYPGQLLIIPVLKR